MSVWVKICGITSIEDGQAAAVAGADAVGLNFVSGPRRIAVERGEDILDSLPPTCESVLLIDITNEHVREPVLDLARRRNVRHLQIYGPQAATWVSRLAREGYRVFLPYQLRECEVRQAIDELLVQCSTAPDAIVLDAYHPELEGGTGRTLNWDRLRGVTDGGSTYPRIILAGGLTPENVPFAIEAVRPYAVDVSSGVEREPGRKDADKMKRFVAAVNLAAGQAESGE